MSFQLYICLYQFLRKISGSLAQLLTLHAPLSSQASLVANCICLPFGTGQVRYSEFIRAVFAVNGCLHYINPSVNVQKICFRKTRKLTRLVSFLFKTNQPCLLINANTLDSVVFSVGYKHFFSRLCVHFKHFNPYSFYATG